MATRDTVIAPPMPAAVPLRANVRIWMRETRTPGEHRGIDVAADGVDVPAGDGASGEERQHGEHGGEDEDARS